MITVFRRLELTFWAAIPSMITLLLLVLYLAPKHVSGLGQFMPLLPLMPVFYWGMQHAREMPYWFVFGIGLIMDATTGAPMGLSSLLFLLFLALLHAQRKYIHKEGFVVKWTYFALLLLVVFILHWVVMSLLAGAMQEFIPPLMQWLFTVCCYPVLHRLFDIMFHLINARRWRLLH